MVNIMISNPIEHFSIGKGKGARLKLVMAGNIYIKASSNNFDYITLEYFPNNNDADNREEYTFDLTPFLNSKTEILSLGSLPGLASSAIMSLSVGSPVLSST